MRLLWPPPEPPAAELSAESAGSAPGEPSGLDALDALDELVAAETRPCGVARPWVAVNTICSLDGAVAVSGRSGPLQTAADLAVFGALRAAADVIVVGAGTARAEGYGPARPSPSRRAARRARGQPETPPIAVVSRSLDLDESSPLLDSAAGTIVLTCEASPPSRRARLSRSAEVIVAGDARVDLGEGLAELGRRGHRFALCEGGPRLNADLIAADLIDEWCLSLSPLLVGGDAERASVGPEPMSPTGFEVRRVLMAEAMLLVRFVRAGRGG